MINTYSGILDIIEESRSMDYGIYTGKTLKHNLCSELAKYIDKRVDIKLRRIEVIKKLDNKDSNPENDESTEEMVFHFKGVLWRNKIDNMWQWTVGVENLEDILFNYCGEKIEITIVEGEKS